MKKLFLLMPVILLALASCDPVERKSDVQNLPAKEQWSKTYDGADETVPQYPDLYSHYWEYAWSMTQNSDLVLKVHGAFPHCRYFSFTLYNDVDGSSINGSSDFELVPDEGSVNPFVETSTKENYYTVYIVPAKATKEQIAKLNSKNIIVVNEEVENACIIIRQYLSEIDEYGGVDMPSIQAYVLSTMKEVAAPLRQESNVFTNVPAFKEQKTDALTNIPFMRAPHGSFYPNNATDYLYTRTALEDNQVLYFSFIPTPMPQKVEDYKDAVARYWSICIGSCMDTRSYYSINYEQAKVADGQKVTFVVCTKQNPKLAEIEARVKAENAKGNNWQIIVWDCTKLSFNARSNGGNETIGNTMILMYRNILPSHTWEHSITKLTPTPYADLSDPANPKNFFMIASEDPDHMIAKRMLGDYGPQATKVTNDEFLAL